MEFFYQLILSKNYFFPLIIFSSTFILSIVLIPRIYIIAKRRGFMVSPSERKPHNGKVPILGGAVIYISIITSFSIFIVLFKELINLSYILASILSMTFLFFLGFKDDLIEISPRKKLIIQLFVAIIALLLTNHYKIDFHNLFGLNVLPDVISFALSVFIIMSFVNAFNFIDGIDGLCSGVSLMAFIFFGVIAVLEHNMTQILINFSFIGALIPFIYCNLFSKEKMFLGDNGSYILGIALALQVIRLLTSHNNSDLLIHKSIPIIILALLSYPLVDSSRVILVRLKNKMSPFTADSNHIHHHLSRLGFSHLHITILILTYTILITTAAVLLRHLDINISYVLFLSVSVIVLNIPVLLVRKKASKKMNQLSKL